jgi:hypothetical protein
VIEVCEIDHDGHWFTGVTVTVSWCVVEMRQLAGEQGGAHVAQVEDPSSLREIATSDVPTLSVAGVKLSAPDELMDIGPLNSWVFAGVAVKAKIWPPPSLSVMLVAQEVTTAPAFITTLMSFPGMKEGLWLTCPRTDVVSKSNQLNAPHRDTNRVALILVDDLY